MNLYLKKISIQEGCNHQFMLATRYEDGKKITISLLRLNDSEAYTGFASDVQLRSIAATLRMTYKDYLNDIRDALQFNNESRNSEFLYCLEQENNDMYFRWKKIVETEEIKINLGRIKVIKNEYYDVMESLLCEISKEFCDLRAKLSEVSSQLKESTNREKNTQDILEKAIQIKSNIETELYSKFVMILNLKKEKIRQLKRKYQDADEKDSYPKHTKKPCGTVNDTLITHVVSEDDDSTDEDVQSKPGTSKEPQKPFNSSFLLYDDLDSEMQCSVAQPRRRQRKAPEKNCPVGVELLAARAELEAKKTPVSTSEDDGVENLFEML